MPYRSPHAQLMSHGRMRVRSGRRRDTATNASCGSVCARQIGHERTDWGMLHEMSHVWLIFGSCKNRPWCIRLQCMSVCAYTHHHIYYLSHCTCKRWRNSLRQTIQRRRMLHHAGMG